MFCWIIKRERCTQKNKKRGDPSLVFLLPRPQRYTALLGLTLMESLVRRVNDRLESTLGSSPPFSLRAVEIDFNGPRWIYGGIEDARLAHTLLPRPYLVEGYKTQFGQLWHFFCRRIINSKGGLSELLNVFH